MKVALYIVLAIGAVVLIGWLWLRSRAAAGGPPAAGDTARDPRTGLTPAQQRVQDGSAKSLGLSIVRPGAL